MLKIKLAQKVLKERGRLKWSQSKLAREADISVPTVVKIEEGHLPSLRILIRLADALNKDPKDLL